MPAELEEGIRRILVEATLTEIELNEDVLECSQSPLEELSEISAHSQSVKPVRMTNWVTNASTEVTIQLQVLDSKGERETRGGHN